MGEMRRAVVEFRAGPLDGWMSDLTTDCQPDLPNEWWPKSFKECGFYELGVESRSDHDFYTYRWHEAGRT